MKKIIGLLLVSILAFVACEPTNHAGPPRPDRLEDGTLPSPEDADPGAGG